MKRTSEVGSTVIEALIALFILAIAGAALAAGTSGGIVAVAGAQRTARDAALILRLDDTLRRAARRVRIPYWRRSVEVDTDAGSVSVPWLDGEEEKNLRVSVNAEGVAVEAGTEKASFTGVEDAQIKELLDPDGAVRGIELRYVIGGKPIRAAAPFSSIALGARKP